jgi:hypothetical protein
VEPSAPDTRPCAVSGGARAESLPSLQLSCTLDSLTKRSLSLGGPTLIMLNRAMSPNHERIGIMAVAVSPWSTTTSVFDETYFRYRLFQTCCNSMAATRISAGRELQRIKIECPPESRVRGGKVRRCLLLATSPRQPCQSLSSEDHDRTHIAIKRE